MSRVTDPRAAFQSAYETMLARWPIAPESRDIVTADGSTRVQVWGATDAPPLILLHGFKVTSTIWGPQAAELGAVRRVYAPDTLGDYGFSSAQRQPRNVADLVRWLVGLADALGLQQFDVGGMSYGGWISAHFAAHHPKRINRLLLFAPGGLFAPFSMAFTLRGLPMLLWRRRGFVDDYLRWAAVPPHADARYEGYMNGLIDVMHTGHRVFPRFSLPLPRGFPESPIVAPTLLLYGDQEKIHVPEMAVARAKAAIRTIECVIVREASHNLTMSQAAVVNKHIIRFLQQPVT
jgi:pimeloyl-ACP methyl ester carboxylesterase